MHIWTHYESYQPQTSHQYNSFLLLFYIVYIQDINIYIYIYYNYIMSISIV